MAGRMKWMRALVLTGAFAALSGMTAFAANMKAGIDSLTINAENPKKLNIKMHCNQDSSGTDGKIYIFEIKPYQSDLSGRKDPITSVDAAADMSAEFALDAGPGEKRLYSAFVAAVKSGSGYEMVSDRHYITNPEVIAPNQEPAKNDGKKGLRVDPNLIDDALSLNIKHAGVDIPTQRFFGQGISYFYEGKTFQINKSLIDQLDQEVKRLSDSGVAVTAILLNGWNSTVPELNRSGITELPKEQALYYAFNVETETGFRAAKAMASYLAKRYNGKNGVGKITNWVVGNEIDNQYWNYTGDYDVQNYMKIFDTSFRVFYTGIKAESANDNVMFSIDHYWGMEPEAAPVGKYKGKDVVEWFNYWDKEQGQTDWGLALHPYPYPLSRPDFWNGDKAKLSNSPDSPVVSFGNLNVVTDFMQTEKLRNPKGQVRNIFLTEEGFTSIQGGEDKSALQAAAVAYSYYIVHNNPYIKAYLMSRQEDSEPEVKVGLAFGLSTIRDNQLIHKQAHDVFAKIDDPGSSLSVSEFAKPIIGIQDWNQVIPGFKAPGQQ
ncbi:DUF5722 domain-containing protein [Oribacterium sp. oral taxon 078]|uniref:DUF5722 domain-containing protein n=1 Tax=Oribacterium sp. oral taxon 078 TaxID=652706 RepID=UPI0001BCC519|nr:DUF5722 domain-containing protein [Oribacterium sp. oral taxon 078]